MTEDLLCDECSQLKQICFCGAPRTRELYEKRLRWANIEHPWSEDKTAQIERMLAEPEKWMSFAKQLERELNSKSQHVQEV